MQKFDLSLWLQDKIRKVVTRDGRPVRIICTDRKAKSGNIVGLVSEDEASIYVWNNNGKHIVSEDLDNDLFFADEGKELTELQKTLEEDCDCYVNLYNDGKTREELREWIKGWCPRIIDLARKELQPEFDKEMDKMLAETDKVVYQKGQQDVLKSLPKLEKTKDCIDPTIPIMYTLAASMKSYVEYNGYKVCINELFESLPKEE